MTLKQTRRFIFEQMELLKAGEISIDEALTQSKLATRIIESYNTEVKAIEVASKLAQPIKNYEDAIKQIEG